MIPSRHISYQARQGRKMFPNGARMAFLLYCALEEWDWDRPYGPDYRPNSDYPGAPSSGHSWESMETAVAYGFNIGLPRFAEIVRSFDLTMTFWTNGLAAERWPRITKQLADEGHEIGGHSYDQGFRYQNLDRAGAEAAVKHGLDAIESVVGVRPSGWVSPAAAATTDTVELLAAQGLLYHGDLQSDEIPYFIDVGGRTMVEIPYRMIGNINDKMLLTRPQRTPDEALAYLTRSFQAHYEWSDRTPLLFNLGLHPYIIGRPDAAWVLQQFLADVTSRGDVWVPTYLELARWWQDEYGDSDEFVPLEQGEPTPGLASR